MTCQDRRGVMPHRVCFDDDAGQVQLVGQHQRQHVPRHVGEQLHRLIGWPSPGLARFLLELQDVALHQRCQVLEHLGGMAGFLGHQADVKRGAVAGQHLSVGVKDASPGRFDDLGPDAVVFRQPAVGVPLNDLKQPEPQQEQRENKHRQEVGDADSRLHLLFIRQVMFGSHFSHGACGYQRSAARTVRLKKSSNGMPSAVLTLPRSAAAASSSPAGQ